MHIIIIKIQYALLKLSAMFTQQRNLKGIHTSPNRAHVHTTYVMLPQHHTTFFYIFKKI